MVEIDELQKLADEVQLSWERLQIRGPGWSGNTREGFEFNPQIESLQGGGGEGGGGGGPPPGTGACCRIDGTCDITTSSYCILTGGAYQGNDTVCGDIDCTHTGACCNDLLCTITRSVDCMGIYQGDGIPCFPNPCTMPDCTCGFDAFDGSGRKFLTRTDVVTMQQDDDCGNDGGTITTGTISTYDPLTCELTCSRSFSGSLHLAFADCCEDSSAYFNCFSSGTACNYSDFVSQVNFVTCEGTHVDPPPTGYTGSVALGSFDFPKGCVGEDTPSWSESVISATQLSGSGSGAANYTGDAVLSSECNPV